METLRVNQVIENLTNVGLSQGLSGRPLKRFVTRQINKVLKKAKKRIENAKTPK